jgi:4-hydroxybenzoate polyprenyltransferase
LTSRFPAWLALLLPLVLALAALREKASHFAQFAISFTMALLLVFELRLWDDLCDIDRDRSEHPERVLGGSASLWPFWALVGLLMAINFALAILLRGWLVAAVLLGMHVLLAAWYGVRRQIQWLPVVNYHVMLLKYPVIVWMLGALTVTDFVGPPLLLAAAMAYLALCIYEVAHDKQLRQLRRAQIIAAVESVLLVALGCSSFLPAGWLRLPP